MLEMQPEIKCCVLKIEYIYLVTLDVQVWVQAEWDKVAGGLSQAD